MFWHPIRSEIKDWFDQKLQQFAEAEKQNPKFSTSQWLDRYIHDGPHEWHFCEFLVLFHEWLTKFTKRKMNFQGGELTSWTVELIQVLQETSNKALWVVEVWLDSILEGYITEFAVDTNKSFSEVEGFFQWTLWSVLIVTTTVN